MTESSKWCAASDKEGPAVRPDAEPRQTKLRLRQQPDRVVILNDISVPRGGATSIALSHARLLAQRGVPVTFITADDGSNVAPRDRILQFETIANLQILDGDRKAAAIRGIYSFRVADALTKWLQQHDTPRTVYHLHSWSKSLSPSAFRALRPVTRRLAVHAHDHFLVCPNGGYFDFQRKVTCDRRPLSMSCLACNCDRRAFSHKLWRSLRQTALSQFLDMRSIGCVIPVHQAMLPHLQRGGIPADRIRAVRNPVTPWRTQRVPAERNKTFLYVGRLDEDKGVDLLCAAARVAKVPLRLVGTGPMAKMLEEKYPEAELCGWRDPEAISDLCLDARAVVMPSQCRETFGLAAFEGLLSGIPALVSEHVMAAQEIVEGGFGLAYNPANIEEFASTLSSFATDDDLAERMSRQAFLAGPSLAPDQESWIGELLDIYSGFLLS